MHLLVFLGLRQASAFFFTSLTAFCGDITTLRRLRR
jgi:hypothetical protein